MRPSRPLFSLVATIVLAVAAVWSASILGGSFVRARSDTDMIRVTGSAHRWVKSDMALWNVTVNARAATVPAAYAKLTADVGKMRAYLRSKGIADADISTASITTTPLFAPRKANEAKDGDGSDVVRPVVAYQLAREVQINTKSVDLVDAVSRQMSELLSQGLDFQPSDPSYMYTRLSDLRGGLLSDAAKDARQRAEWLATNSGCRVGSVRSVQMGVLQLSSPYTHDLSDVGANDTSSINKDAFTTVRVGFTVR